MWRKDHGPGTYTNKSTIKFLYFFLFYCMQIEILCVKRKAKMFSNFFGNFFLSTLVNPSLFRFLLSGSSDWTQAYLIVCTGSQTLEVSNQRDIFYTRMKTSYFESLTHMVEQSKLTSIHLWGLKLNESAYSTPSDSITRHSVIKKSWQNNILGMFRFTALKGPIIIRLRPAL